jgi:hypothetical protein
MAFETLHCELLKLRMCVLIIFAFLSLRKWPVNAHCDLNTIIFFLGEMTHFGPLRKPESISMYFFIGRAIY